MRLFTYHIADANGNEQVWEADSHALDSGVLLLYVEEEHPTLRHMTQRTLSKGYNGWATFWRVPLDQGEY